MSKEKQKPVKEQEFRHLVRVLGVIVDGKLSVERALMKIKGIGPQISHALEHVLGISVGTKVGSLKEEEVTELEEMIGKLNKTLPSWMLNRQKDLETGDNLHLITSELDMSVREDINRMKKIKSYKGVRHSIGQPVRGQRTRSSFRKGATLGVSRKKA